MAIQSKPNNEYLSLALNEIEAAKKSLTMIRWGPRLRARVHEMLNGSRPEAKTRAGIADHALVSIRSARKNLRRAEIYLLEFRKEMQDHEDRERESVFSRYLV